MRVIDPLNLDAELIVALRPCGPARRRCPLVPMAMICRRGDRQHGADRLDPEHGAMVGDELDHRGDVLRRSSSAWAKYANAFRRISFARFSSRTSRSSSFNRSRSLVVRPGRCPASRCTCRTHFRSVSAVQPSFGATDCSTAHAEAWASRCSSTIRTARSRTSGENRLGRPIDPILPSNEVSEKPGTIHERAATAAACFNHRLLRDFDVIELQADERCTFIGSKRRTLWLFATIEVCSRLWAGSVLGRRSHRNTKAAINDVILRGRRVGCPLIATDGVEYYVGVMVRLLGSACVYGQVLKTRRNNRVVRVERRMKIGTASRLNAALLASEDAETLNTSFIERLNLTIRQGSAYLRRRSPCHARGADQLRGHVELLRCYYNFIRPHPGVEVRARDQDAGDAGRSGEPALGVARHLHGGRSHATYLCGRRARVRDRPAHGI